MHERSLGFDLSSLGFWLIVVFCFLRSVEVLFLQGSLPYIQYAIAVAGFLYLFVSVNSILGRPVEELKVGYGFFLPVALFVAVLFQVLSFGNLFDEFGRGSHGYIFQTTFVVLAWFYAGGLASRWGRGSSILVWPIYLMFVLLLVMVLFSTNFGLSIPYSAFEESGAFEVMNHLLLAEYMLLVCYAAYIFSSAKFRPAVFFLMAYIMFAGGGRASFLIGIVSILLHEYFFGARRVFLFICSLGFLFGLILVFRVDVSDSAFQYMLFSEGFDRDNSYIGRMSQVEAGIGNLGNQFFFGDVSFFVRRFNNLGSYIHNIISVWQFYGFFVFALCLWMVFAAKRNLAKVLCLKKISVLDKFFLLVFIYSLISVLFVKHVGFGSFWYALGYWLLQSRKRLVM